MFHELLSRDREDGRATGQPQGVAPEAYLNGTSQGTAPEDARKDGHIRCRSKRFMKHPGWVQRFLGYYLNLLKKINYNIFWLHLWQYIVPAELTKPQLWQVFPSTGSLVVSLLPHFEQNKASGSAGAPHW
jgi:hypothetical protein